MELRHLRYFQAVAKTLSFSRAAAELRVAQSAVSRQIMALEHELGLKLFVRSTSRVRLTEAGRHFHQEIDRLLGHLAIAITGAQQIDRGHGGDFNIGSDWRILLPHVPEAVVAYRALHPHVSVNFVELRMHAQIEALNDGRIHLGFVHKTIIGLRTGFETHPVYNSEMKLAVSSRHRLARSGRIAMSDLRQETWLRLDEKNNPGFRAFVTQFCHAALFTPKFGRTAQSLEGMLALVAMGDGICLIPAALVTRVHPDLRYLETDCLPFELFAIWRKDSPPAGLAAFLKLLQKTFSTKRPGPVAAT